ncbi:hypothetical protein [Vibrio sp. Isolate24]|uniref:hypothetical protein n=1 Tax=Vibrio sp. Isolate24 TaxID=2908534 RepID=UPI001EFD9314|nr:hypothetical protein [Vibrio sp. Isolate24]MCG9678959.1 hypothetical protein [Vibrio sp. Isolate24]
MVFFKNESKHEEQAYADKTFYIYTSKRIDDSHAKQRAVYNIETFIDECKHYFYYEMNVQKVFDEVQLPQKHRIPKFLPKISKLRHDNHNRFTVRVNKRSQVASFGPKSNLGLLSQDYKNSGIGRYCMAYLVRLLVERKMGEYNVTSPSLSLQDAQTEEARNVRNYFYLNSGFNFDDINIEAGHCNIGQVKDLKQTHNRGKVRRIDSQYLLPITYRKNHSLQHQCLNYEYQIEHLKKFDDEANETISLHKAVCVVMFLAVIWLSPLPQKWLLGTILVSGVIVVLNHYYLLKAKSWFGKKLQQWKSAS